jgi:hypothetical protein
VGTILYIALGVVVSVGLMAQNGLPERSQPYEYVPGVASASALLSGDVTRAERYAKNGEVHSASVTMQMKRALDPPKPWEEPKEDGHWPDRAAVFAAAQTGDAAKVATVLTSQRATGREVLRLVQGRLRARVHDLRSVDLPGSRR